MKLCKLSLFTSFFLFAGSLTHARDLKLHDLLSLTIENSEKITLKKPTPFINSLQLRISADNSWENEFSKRRNTVDPSRDDNEDGDSHSNSQELTLRFKVDNLTEYKLKSALAKNQEARKKIVTGMSLGGQAKSIISLYIGLQLSREKARLLKRLNVIHKDKVKVLKAMSKKGSADVVDYLDAVNKLEASTIDIEMHRVALENIVKTINSELNKDSNWILVSLT